MTAFPLSPPSMYAAARATVPRVHHGHTTALEKIQAVALLTAVSFTWLVPFSIVYDRSAAELAWECLYSPLVQGVLLVVFMSVVERLAVPGLARTLALVGAAVLASVLAGIAEGITLPAIGVWKANVPFLVSFWGNLGTLMVTAICFVLIYDYRVRLRYRVQAISDMRLRRARLVRETVESQLQAMQARVEPKFLFDAMNCVERTYAQDPARGDLLLDDLIAYLRAMLPDLRTTTSTLARELALGRAYVDISAMILGRRVALEVDTPPTPEAIAFPPMCLVPMLQFLLADTPGDHPLALTFGVRVLESAIVVDARAPDASVGPTLHEAEALEAMRRRLQDVYGERTRLTLDGGAAKGRRVLLEIPHEHPDSPDRRG